MNDAQVTFSFPCYRRLCKYLGESDAAVELTELFARSFCAEAQASGDEEGFISKASQKFGVRVNLSKADRFLNLLHRNYIVSVYAAAELFLHDFRREHIRLFQKDWIGDANNVDKLTLTLKNVALTQGDGEQIVGKDLISIFNYYKLVRNSTVHVADCDKQKTEIAFKQIAEYSVENKLKYSSVIAPNEPSKLNFDDFVLFSRITKGIAEGLCRMSQPQIEHWHSVMTADLARIKCLNYKRERMLNFISGKLRTEWGFDIPSAKGIAVEVLGIN